MQTTSPDPGPPTFVAWLPFVAVAGVVTALAAAGVLPRWDGLVHAVAPPPLDLWFDLRVLVARSPSYAVGVTGLVASLAIRTLVLASLLEALGDPRPLGQRVRSSALFYAVAAVPLSVASGLGFAGLASVYAWYAWAGLAIGGLAVVRLMPRAVGARRPWTSLWALAAVAALGAGSRLGGGVTAVALVPVSAVLTVLVLRRMRGPTRPGAATVPVALVGLLGLVPAPPAGPPIAAETVLFLVPGVDTASGRGALYRFRPSELGIGCERVFYYSYLGPGKGAPRGEAACPIVQHAAYRKDDTQRPLQELADAFVRQVARIRRRAGDVPVAVVTHSQGAVIAWEAISSGRAEGVSHLVALGGIPHSPVGYPPPGADGEGRIGADALRILSAASRDLGSGTFSPDAPLAREILARPDGLEEVFAAPLPEGISAASVATSFDLIVSPEGWRIPGVPGWMVDTTHVGVAYDERAYAAVGALLRGSDPPDRSLVAPLVDALVHAFMPPPAEADGTG